MNPTLTPEASTQDLSRFSPANIQAAMREGKITARRLSPIEDPASPRYQRSMPVATNYGVQGILFDGPPPPQMRLPGGVMITMDGMGRRSTSPSPDPMAPPFDMNLPPHVTVCSVWPLPVCTPEGLTSMLGDPQFGFPAIPMGQFACLRIYHGMVASLNIEAHESAEVSGELKDADRQIGRVINPKIIAEDIVRQLSGDMTLQGFKPGCMIIANDLPTEDEYLQLLQMNQGILKHLVEQADTEWYKDEKGGRATIRDLHRKALEMLGDLDEIRHPWYSNVQARANKKCPGCRNTMDADALICDKCRSWLPDLYITMGVEPTDDPAVMPFWKTRREQLMAAAAPTTSL